MKVFLLSPANAAAVRGRLLLNTAAEFELAKRVQGQGASIGEIYSFISSLYFRGKLAYAKTFSKPHADFASRLVITTSRGLVAPETILTIADLMEMAGVPIDPSDARYRDPLVNHASALAEKLPTGCDVVLLGSIASGKYVDPLLEIFGERLLFPREFVGRGDMSRGGLMLRCVREMVELEYVPVGSTVRHGARPARLRPARV